MIHNGGSEGIICKNSGKGIFRNLIVINRMCYIYTVSGVFHRSRDDFVPRHEMSLKPAFPTFFGLTAYGRRHEKEPTAGARRTILI
jgi:hypothetical protein